MTKAVVSVRERWEREGILNPEHASSDEVAAFEQKYGVILPNVVREYFTSLNGTAEGQAGMDDADQVGFWHLDQVRRLDEYTWAKLSGPEDLFVFADWMIHSTAYAIKLSAGLDAPGEVFIVYDPPQAIACSFEEFLQRYSEGDVGLLFPKATQGDGRLTPRCS